MSPAPNSVFPDFQADAESRAGCCRSRSRLLYRALFGIFGVQLATQQVVDVAEIVDIVADRLTTVEILEFSMMRISRSVTSHTKLLKP